MLARTHGLFAFGSVIGVLAYTQTKNISTATLITSLLFNTVGALLPDIDQASNRLWDLFPGGEMIGKGLGVFLRHRGISHSIIGIFLVDKFFFWLLSNLFNDAFLNINFVYWSVMIGYISHLFADSFTEEGVPLLYPLKINFGFPPIKSWRIKTGRWFENLIITPTLILLIIWIIVHYGILAQIA